MSLWYNLATVCGGYYQINFDLNVFKIIVFLKKKFVNDLILLLFNKQ